jgi:8-oxo-dGTP pyrophosphatase MutT (NUDIX family)
MTSFEGPLPIWDIVREDTELTLPILRMKRRRMRRPSDGKEGDFFIAEAPLWVNVIAITTEGMVVLVEQYRHGIHEISLEVPGGVADGEGSGLDAAQRELAEETGFSSGKWTFLGSVTANPAIFNNRCEIYLAEDCIRTQEQDLDPFEEIRVVLLSEKEFLEAIRTGRIHHSLAVAAVALWTLRG